MLNITEIHRENNLEKKNTVHSFEWKFPKPEVQPIHINDLINLLI